MKNEITGSKGAQLLLRIALAFGFLYAAAGSFLSPSEWIGFFPEWMFSLAPAEFLLPAFSLFEILLALWLLSGWRIKEAALLSAAVLFGIVIFNIPQLIIVFRDVGLGIAALALALLSTGSGGARGGVDKEEVA